MAKKHYIDTDSDTSDLENKLAVLEDKESHESTKPRKTTLVNIARDKLEAMDKFRLKPATIAVKAELELDDDFNFTMIAKKLSKDKQALAAEYILDGIERDIKKVGIFDMKK